MEVDAIMMEKLIFSQLQSSIRFTQDSPVYPDVWMEYFKHSDKIEDYRADLILTPHHNSTAGELLMRLTEKMKEIKGEQDEKEWIMASSGSNVVARLTLDELIRVALPMTKWWQQYMWHKNAPTPDQVWLKELVGALYYKSSAPKTPGKSLTDKELQLSFHKIFDQHKFPMRAKDKKEPTCLWSVSKNRPATISIDKSVPATKADACRRVFGIDGSDITWAVLDTGIDARHLAFRKNDPRTGAPIAKALGRPIDNSSNHTRVVATYDFTRFREVISMIHGSISPQKIRMIMTGSPDDKQLPPTQVNNIMAEVGSDLKKGYLLDWAAISPLFRIPHNSKDYVPPVHPHGTHVAGIIGASLEDKAAGGMIGMCPGINLYDIRVLDSNGQGEEFNILAAIQFIRWLNSQKDGILVHGVNLSFSMLHEVASYACGQTPVCEACDRLCAEGTIAVAAAGNLGQAIYQAVNGTLEQGFRMVNITDPGNAENVITVGATHRYRPHSYGVSYFSSKGPTGDGRLKPDIVAPGEKVVSATIGEGTVRMDGTSMAAPHVSGAAALLLTRYRELIGRPRRIKEILCKTATDLGREKYFQGCGMLDVLRAIQSI